MSDFDDRIIDLGLEEVVGDATPPDLTERVLRAASERDQEEDRESEDERAARFRREARFRPSRFLIRTAAAAAVLLAIALLAKLVLDRGPSRVDDPNVENPPVAELPDEPAPFAVADAELVVLRGEDLAEELTTLEIEDGDTLIHAGSDPMWLRFADGSEIALGERTVVRLGERNEDPDSVIIYDNESRAERVTDPGVDAARFATASIYAGEIEVFAGDRDWSVELPAGECMLTSTSRARIGVIHYERKYEEDVSLVDDLRSIARKVPAKRWTDSFVRCLQGSCSGRFGDGPEELAPGDEMMMWMGEPARRGRMLTEQDRVELTSAIADIRVAEDVLPDSADFERLDAAADLATQRLRRRLADWPAGWDFLRAALLKLCDAKSRTNRYRGYSLVLDDPHPWTRGRVELVKDPELWDPDILMRLAENDAELAYDRLQTWVRARKPALEEQVYAALFLAIRDDDSGRRVLRRGSDGKSQFLRDSNAYFASAAGLALLGQKEPWLRGLEYLREELQRIEEREGVEATPVRVLRAKYFHRAIESDEPIELVDMDTPVVDFIEKRIDSYPDRETLIAEIDRMRLE